MSQKSPLKFFKWIQKHSALVGLCLSLFAGFLFFKLVGCGTTYFQYVPGGVNDTTALCEDPLVLCCNPPEVPNEEGTKCVLPGGGSNCLSNPRECVGSSDGSRNVRTYPPGDREPLDRNYGSGEDSEPVSRDYGTSVVKEIRLGKVDILFVVDNSSSMHEEHKNIQNQFDDFMDDIEDLDYRLAITTVDISSSPGNVEREYQDGRFIRFNNREIFLHNDEEDKRERRRRHQRNTEYFKEAIVREETRRCKYEERDQNSTCPTDERAICAVNKSLGRSKEGSFFRTDSDVFLAIVILSDEDERSSQSYIDFKGPEYAFENCDEPETLHVNIYNRLGSSKSYSTHSIVVPPGDESCLSEQQSDRGSGHYGETYAKLSHPSARVYDSFPGLYEGSIISICDRNYSSQLNVLSDYLLEPKPITLPCEVAEDSVSLRQGYDDVRFRVEGKKVFVEEKIPVHSDLKIRYTCS